MGLVLKSTGKVATIRDGKAEPPLLATFKPKPVCRTPVGSWVKEPMEPSKRRLSPAVVRKCMGLLYDDPSGEACTAYLEQRYSTRILRERYFDEADKKLWGEASDNSNFLSDLRGQIAFKQDQIEQRAKSILKRLEAKKLKAGVK